ncbi:MAG TPA: hypothetical protein VNV37_11180 [Solirubrobacteraceae bacterium]|nr:hypothetical protein [Solirubrobacteraceae bacterium]
MSTQRTQGGMAAQQDGMAARQGGHDDAGAGPGGQPSEAELRAAYEAELSRITSADMVLQATVSLLNIGARRLGLVGGGAGGGTGGDPNTLDQGGAERDLEQVRDAIDAVRGLMPVIERRAPQEARPLRDALSQLQMAYAREAPTQPPAPQGAAGSPPPQHPPQPSPAKDGPGPAEASGRLWVPGR